MPKQDDGITNTDMGEFCSFCGGDAHAFVPDLGLSLCGVCKDVFDRGQEYPDARVEVEDD